jgi:thiol-disulfide isomerase/thioredoxin
MVSATETMLRSNWFDFAAGGIPMRVRLLFCLLILCASRAIAESGPTDPKAQKSYAEGLDMLKHHREAWALDAFKKAAKQDGKCIACDQQIINLGLELEDYKAAMAAGQHVITLVHNPKDIASAHYLFATALLRAGSAKHKEDLLNQSHEQYMAALQANPDLHQAIFGDAMALAWLNQDAPARERFLDYMKVANSETIEYKRAQRYSDRPELVRARMAPAFNIKTIDGRIVSLDDLAGKVVLLDFWATWCGPCREALPHVQEIAKKFAGQPLVVMSISLDNDDQKWRDFVGQHGMTWIQARDGGFDGAVATTFGVRAIPATFTIDADGVLQDQHVGDADIEGKLKKLVARAQALQAPTQNEAQAKPGGGL